MIETSTIVISRCFSAKLPWHLKKIEECFSVPPELMLEYVVAVVDVKEQKLKLFLEKIQVDEFSYKLR